MADKPFLIPCHLENVIQKIVQDLNIVSNYKLIVRQPLKPGDNWVGIIIEIELVSEKYNKKFVELNVMAKLAPTNTLYRNFFSIHLCYKREIFAYKKILPEFINLQVENKIKNIFGPFAKCYQTLLDKNQETVVLENMTKHGYKSVNNGRPVDYKHAELIMVALGKLHALSYALRNQKPELFKEIGVNTEDSFFNSHVRNHYLNITQNIGKRVLNYLNKNNVVIKEFEHFLNDPFFVVDKLVKSEPAGRYSVICHGDTQTRNMLFKYENNLEPDTPTNLCLIDWQLCKLGSPCLDIAFFIWTCTDRTLRNSYYEELLETYYRSLSSALRELGECSEKCYPKDVFRNDLKTFSVYGLFISLWVVWTNMLEVKDFPDINSAKDFESLTSLISNPVNDEDAFFKRMKDLIEDFIKYGYDMHENIFS